MCAVGHAPRPTTRDGPEWAQGNHIINCQLKLSPGHGKRDEKKHCKLYFFEILTPLHGTKANSKKFLFVPRGKISGGPR